MKKIPLWFVSFAVILIIFCILVWYKVIVIHEFHPLILVLVFFLLSSIPNIIISYLKKRGLNTDPNLAERIQNQEIEKAFNAKYPLDFKKSYLFAFILFALMIIGLVLFVIIDIYL